MSYGNLFAFLKREDRCPPDVEHRQIKNQNNIIKCNHFKLKRIIGAKLIFKSMNRLTPN